MTVESINMVASHFLADMFGASTAAPVYISSLPNADAREREVGERHVTTRQPEDIEAFLRKWDRPDRAAYFCTATVQAGATTRSKATLAELNGLHIDIDFKSITISAEEAEHKLQQLMLLPSKVVASGGGLHAYWLFKEALPATPEHIERVEGLLQLLADHLGGDPACAEASRLMRLPGSHNTKDGAWTEVRIITDRPLRYEIDELAEWLEVASPVIHRRPAGGNNGNGGNGTDFNNPWLAVAARFGIKPPIDVEARLDVMMYQGAGDSGIHATQISVTAALLNRGQSIDEVVDIVLAATRAAAGHYGERWNWRREERAIRGMCETWLTKHPEITGTQADDGKADTAAGRQTPEPTPPLAPYVARPFSQIPLRQWLHAGHYIRQQVVMTVAPGGYGKTSLIIVNVIELCLGIGLIGPAPSGGQLRVAYWNAEDPPEEVERRVAAVCLHHEIEPERLEGQLYFGSKIIGDQRIAMLDRGGNVVLNSKLLGELMQFIKDNQIDCAIFDPLIAFHRVPEGDNVAMEQVVRVFEQIATDCDCCVELSQHTRKSGQGQQGEITTDDSRGAGAITNAARSVRILNRMTAQEAEMPKIAAEERRHYLRVSRDKTNLAPPGKATWVHLVSVELPNGDGVRPGDNVQAVEAWDYPQAFDGVTTDDMRWAREEVRRKAYRTQPRSPEWFGYALADRLGLDIGDPETAHASRDLDEKGNWRRITTVIKTWLDNGVLDIFSPTASLVQLSRIIPKPDRDSA